MVFPHPFEQYARQIGSFSQVGVNIKHVANRHLEEFDYWKFSFDLVVPDKILDILTVLPLLAEDFLEITKKLLFLEQKMGLNIKLVWLNG